jgi:uncharacterized protein
MTERYHAIPPELFDALAAGGSGPEAIEVLTAAEQSKHSTLLRGVLAAADQAGRVQARLARLCREALAEVEHRAPDVAVEVMGYPAVGAWAIRTLRALETGGRTPARASARLAHVAAAAAIRSGLDVELPVRPAAGIVSLPSVGAARVEADSAVLTNLNGRAEIRWAGGRLEIPQDPYRDAPPGWLGIRRYRAGRFTAAIEDLDPFRMPAVSGLAPRLTARQAQTWKRALRQGWHVLATGHPVIAAEVAAAVSAIVPLRGSNHGQLSSTAPESFGAVAMSEPADPDICASTFTHEIQHLKLCAVLDIVDLFQPDDGRRYYAPWRADPRPVAGLLQGAYAYLGVTEFWRRQRQLTVGPAQARADGEFARWRTGTIRVIDTLLSTDRLTPAGTRFVGRMRETTRDWAAEPVSPQAREFALAASREHLSRWERDNGPVPI